MIALTDSKYSTLLICLAVMIATGCAVAPKANWALGQLHLGNHQMAWKMISEELENPTASSQEGLCEANAAALQIIENTWVRCQFKHGGSTK